MKLPRCLMIAMLTTSVLVPLAAAGWWWVTWPERTAREYVALMAEQRFDDARDMLMEPPTAWTSMPGYSETWNHQNMQLERRTWWDLTVVCQKFKLQLQSDRMYAAVRGKIIDPHSWHYGPVV